MRNNLRASRCSILFLIPVFFCLALRAAATNNSPDKIPFVKAMVSGVVVDSSGNPLAGASVTEKGKSNAVVTNANGEFTINVADGAILVFSFVGYTSVEVNAENGMRVVLQTMAISNEEVIVTALGIRKEKTKVLYATQEVKGTALEKAPESNVANNLVGKVAGLNILTKSNLYENPDILMRGKSTLIVIDGVPTDPNTFDFWSLNPNDIDNVNVLKGTAAAALYGSLGINGAIMITTKKGKSGASGTEVVFNSTTQFQAGFLKIPEVQDQYGMGWSGNYAFTDGKGGGGWYDDYGYVWGPKLNVKNSANPSGFNEYPQYNSPYDPDNTFEFTQGAYTDRSHYKPIAAITRGKNNLTNFLNNEMTTTQNISLSGKGGNGDYRISVTHMYQKGQVPNTKLNATTVSLGGSVRVGTKLKFESSLAYNKQYSPNYPQTGYGANNFFYNLLLWMGPDVDVRDMRDYWKPSGGYTNAAGNFVPYGVKNIQQMNYNYSWYNNPYYLAYESLNGYQNDVITGQVTGTYDLSKDLQLLVRSGINANNALATLKTPKSYIYYGNGELNGNYSETRRSNFQIVTDALLTYKKTFLQELNTTLSVGGSNRYNQNSNLSARTNGLNVPVNYNLGNSIAPVAATNNLAEKKVNSLFGYLDADYKGMVFINLSGRKDYTTNLQKPNNAYFYPSASMGIVPTSMATFPEFVSFLKLRGSWSQVSTDNINIGDQFQNWYATIPVYQSGPRWNGSNASLNLPGTLIQKNIKPNKTVSWEYGVELRLFNNRIGADVTMFNYTDKDFAIQAPVSSASGFNFQLVNGDVINRKGTEISVTATPVRTTDFKWDVGVNYSTVHSYYREFYGGEEMRNAVKVGERVDVFRGWDWERDPGGQLVIGSNGFPKYIDHEINMGHTDPDYIFGINNTLNYKSFGLSFSFDGRIGGVMYNGLEQKLYEGGMHPGTANSYRDDAYEGKKSYVGQGVVITEGQVSYDIQGKITSDTRKFAPNTQGVNYIDWIFATYVNGIPGADMYKRDFVKLREVVLSYNISRALISKSPFKAASISITGRNLLLFTKVPFMDPDGYSGTELAEPTYRNIGINLNLKF